MPNCGRRTASARELLRHLPQALDRAIRAESSAFRHLWANATRYWLARTAAQGARPGRAGSLSPRGGPNAARPVDARAVPAGWKALRPCFCWARQRLHAQISGAWLREEPTVGDCLSSACASFQYAYGRSADGDVVRVEGGTYGPQVVPDGGKRVTFQGTPGNSVPPAPEPRVERDIRRSRPGRRRHEDHWCRLREPR